MAAPDEIRSTEKLLELIRTPSRSDQVAPSRASGEKGPGRKRSSLIPSVRLKKKCTVGVDIGHTYIRIARTGRLPDKTYVLLDYLDLPFKKPASLKDPDVLEQLKAGLDQICENSPDCDIWSAIPSAKVETRHLLIPKLPRKQIANAVYWAFTRKVTLNEPEETLDYEILGETVQDGIPKTEVLAFKTPKAEAAEFKAAFEQIGYPLTGITIAPFAVQNLFRAKIVAPEESEVCCLYVGRDWSRIALYSDGNLMLSRGVKAGMRSMVEAIDIALRKEDGSGAGNKTSRREDDSGEDDGRTSPIQPAAQQLFFELIGRQNAPDGVPPQQARRDPQGVFEMILPALERLIRQVERTFEHYAMNFHRGGVRRIYLSGQITANPMIVNHFTRQLDMPLEVMNPFMPDTPFVRPVNIPGTQDERESYVPAIGLAVSRKAMTPNGLFTHQQRDEEEDIRRTNMRVLTGFMVLLMVFIGIFSWQERQLDGKRRQVDKLNQQLSAYSPPAEKEVLLALYSQSQNKQQSLQRIVQRYAPVAVLNELAQITPANIRLIRVDADFALQPSKNKTDARQIMVEGLIFGTPETFEATLTGYLLSLRNSPVFNKPSILKKSQEYYNDQEVMHFRARLEII